VVLSEEPIHLGRKHSHERRKGRKQYCILAALRHNTVVVVGCTGTQKVCKAQREHVIPIVLVQTMCNGTRRVETLVSDGGEFAATSCVWSIFMSVCVCVCVCHVTLSCYTDMFFKNELIFELSHALKTLNKCKYT